MRRNPECDSKNEGIWHVTMKASGPTTNWSAPWGREGILLSHREIWWWWWWWWREEREIAFDSTWDALGLWGAREWERESDCPRVFVKQQYSFIGGRIFIIHDYCTSIGAITNSKQCHQKRSNKWWKKMLEGDGIMFLRTSLIYMKRSGGVLASSICHSNIGHTFASNTIINYQMSVVTKKNQ